jgi:cell division septal protein FtsQ
MAKKRSNTTTRSRTAKTNRRQRSTTVRSRGASNAFGRFGLPLLISFVLVVALGVVGALFYRSATDSEFFQLATVDIRGNNRTPEDEIRRLVTADVERTGVWNADVSDLRTKIEKFPFVKTASVSRQLPSGIRVDVVERIPSAAVRLRSGDFLVDEEGTILAALSPNEKTVPFVLLGWDESKTEKAPTENKKRLTLYRKMLEEWRPYDLSARVKLVDLSNLGEPSAVIEDSGRDISIVLAKERLGQSLKIAIEAVAGKGAKVRSVNSGGIYPVINFIEY